MRLLHTSDWHVGKLIRGRSRADEHRAVLDEIAGIAAAESVDAVLVAGDLFETAAPGPESEEIVYKALIALGEVAPVVVVGGNHDNPRRLDAVRPLLDHVRVHMVAAVRDVDDGGVVELTGADGVHAHIVCLPFVSKRGVVRAEALMANTAAENNQVYSARLTEVIGHLCRGFSADTVNIVCGHAFAENGVMGGGERSAHTVMEYAVSAQAFPVGAQYVALGHLHRPQKIPGPVPIHYSGSPLQLDFGEGNDTKSVQIVDVAPGVPAKTKAVPLTEGRQLRTLLGSLADLEALAGTTGDDYLRIIVTDTRRAGLADDVRTWFPHAVAVEVRSPDAEGRPQRSERAGRTPSQLFEQYLVESAIDDARLVPAFETLLDEVQGAPS